MARILPAAAIAIALLAPAPLQAGPNGDMFGGAPPLPPGQSDMFPSPPTSAPAADLFQGSPPPPSPAPDMFPEKAPEAPTADMLGNTPNAANPGIEDKFSAHGAPQAPPYSLFHNPNASGQ